MLGLLPVRHHWMTNRPVPVAMATAGRHTARRIRNGTLPAWRSPDTGVSGPDACKAQLDVIIRRLTRSVSPSYAPQALRRLATADETPLTRAQLRSVRNACRRVSDHHPGTFSGLDGMRVQALHDYCQAGLKQMQLARRSARIEHGLRGITRPGAERTVAASVSLGVGVGVPGTGIRLGLDTRLAGASRRACFETLEYAEGRQISVSAAAAAELTPQPVTCGGVVGASFQHATFRGAVSSRAFAQQQARESLNGSRLSRVGRSILRLFGRRGCPRDPYADAQRAAARWDPLLPALTCISGDGQDAVVGAVREEARWGVCAEPVIDVRVRSTVLQCTVRAASGTHTAGSLAAERATLDVELDVPVWLPDAHLQPAERAELAGTLGERILRWCEPAHAPTPMLLTAMLRNPDEPGYAQHEQLLQHLQAEWHLLRELLIRRGRCPDSRQLHDVKAHLWQQWGCSNSRMLTQRMLDVCHWVHLSAPSRRHGNDVTAATLEEQARALAHAIIASPALDQDRGWLQRIHATRPLRQQMRQTTVQAGGAAPLPGATVGVGITVARGSQRNYNPLRDGQYIDATIAMGGVADAESLLRLLRRAVPEADVTLAVEQIGLAGAGPFACWGDATAALTLRWFRPSFQDDVDYPAACRGFHLQQLRSIAATSIGAGGQLPLALVPGVELAAGIAAGSSSAAPLQADVFFPATATATLLRYQSLLGQGMARHQAWRHMLHEHGTSLRSLDAALRRPQAPAAAEIFHWLRRRPAGERPAGALWTQFLESPRPKAEENNELAALWTVFDQVLPALAAAQSRSPLTLALRLPVT